jgi:hypothetical protein
MVYAGMHRIPTSQISKRDHTKEKKLKTGSMRWKTCVFSLHRKYFMSVVSNHFILYYVQLS